MSGGRPSRLDTGRTLTLMEKRLCDGSPVTWEPRWVDVECDECGHITGQRDVAEPLFHGVSVKRDGRFFCSRCNVQYTGMAELNEHIRERMLPTITEQIEKSSPLFSYLRRST